MKYTEINIKEDMPIVADAMLYLRLYRSLKKKDLVAEYKIRIRKYGIVSIGMEYYRHAQIFLELYGERMKKEVQK